MRGISKVLCAVLVLLVFVGGATAALGGAESPAARGTASLRIYTPGQKQLLRSGLLMEVVARRAGRITLVAHSSTFDAPGFRRLTTTKRLRFASPDSRLVHLPLTRAGRQAVRSCTGRNIRVRGGGGADRAELFRNTGACKQRRIDLANADRCDFLDGSRCLLPFPNDYYTVRDRGTETGRRVNLKTASMPANTAGVQIDARPYNRNDGFSPGQLIVLRVPGMNSVAAVKRTGAVPITDLGRYSRRNQPVVVINTRTGERHPIWVEIDSVAADPSQRALLIRPAVNFDQKTRYVVALRNLKTASGRRIGAPTAFRYYRDDLPSNHSLINRRRPHFERIFRTLRQTGIRRSNLYLAWDFTVASDRNISERMLSVRDRAFAGLGDTDLSNLTVEGVSPGFTVTSAQSFIPCGGDGCQAGEDDFLQRQVRGTVTVPCFLSPDCAPGARFALGADGLPTRNGTWEANFVCNIPRVTSAANPGKAALYGHGLLNNAEEGGTKVHVRAMGNEHNFLFCASDWIGMSTSDLGNLAGILVDLSNFPDLADRVQQAYLNFLFIGRAMIHPSGFASDPAFQDGGGAPLINTDRLYFDGNSQGGILGGGLTAVAPDFTRAALGVPAMNFSTLLTRSVDFDNYANALLYPSYTDQLQRPLLLSLIQMLWDRSEANGYAHRMTTNPLPDTPAHQVLLQVSVGDHQVTTYAVDVEARTIGARIRMPAIAAGRTLDVDPFWGIAPITGFPFAGSALVYWDIGPPRSNPTPPPAEIGVPPPPTTNTPNRSGQDSHYGPRNTPAARQQKAAFLSDPGTLIEVCGSGPCVAVPAGP